MISHKKRAEDWCWQIGWCRRHGGSSGNSFPHNWILSSPRLIPCPYVGTYPAEPTTPWDPEWAIAGIAGISPITGVCGVAVGRPWPWHWVLCSGHQPMRHLSFSTPVGAASGSNWCSWPASRPCWILISKRDSVRFLGRWLVIPSYSSCRWAPGSGPENILKRSGLHGTRSLGSWECAFCLSHQTASKMDVTLMALYQL